MTERFSAEDALRPLKSFQRTTVDYVSRRLLTDADSVRHFLVADEVGLGKTMVARGVIARTIEALQDTVPRIDIVYICSNGAIAKQNVARLNVMGDANARVLPTRLTMLAQELGSAGGIKDKGVNFFSLTPGTSLDLKQGGGMAKERALLLKLLWPFLCDRVAVPRMFQGYSGRKGWLRTRRKSPRVTELEHTIVARFRTAVAKETNLLKALEDCAQVYKVNPEGNTDLNRLRETLVGAFRTILARESAGALEPDLIVLDEFQRFTDLLHGEGEAAELARKLFDAEDSQGNRANVLLLSATPYRMLSLREDDADAGDHYREFLDVLGFLFGDRGPAVRAELETEMRRFRNAMQALPGSFDTARKVKSGIEGMLRQVIARTERVSETEQRDAMMRDVDVPITVEPADLIEARAVAHVAAAADAPGTVEYWKSAPYLLNFLRDYKLGQRLDYLKKAPSEALTNAIRAAKSAQINVEDVENYRPVPENNGRMRALKTVAFKDDMAKRLWVPPSLPYFGPRVSASKMLIFSQWAMVPDAIAALLSYNSERAMGMGGLNHRYSDAFRKQSQPLSFRRTKGRLTGLRALPLVIPSPTLAAAADPLEIFRSGVALPDTAAMRDQIRARIKDHAQTVRGRLQAVQRGGAIARLFTGMRANEPKEPDAERATNWDWACAASLDVAHAPYQAWLARGRLLSDIIRDEGQESWHDHVSALNDAANADHVTGQPDYDSLLDHLTDLALGSPATCALRALHRIAPDLGYDDPAILNAAARIGMAFRGLFNQPESQALLRSDSDDVYWQTVLDHCASHDLQSVMDEYVHILVEAEGLSDAAPAEAVGSIAAAIDDALSLKPAQIEIKQYRVKRGRIDIQPALRMRGRFATRLLQGGQEDGVVQRTDTVRTAFNSPFRPFVLASTSVGQEGLDFHPYCHRLVHWNLPSNPVDLEQREGRVHRYKNHAVRLNLASRYAHTLHRPDPVTDPWQDLFQTAHCQAERPGDLEPFWLLDGDVCIERYALSLPYSREATLLGWLKRSVALYRLAFGQPRQDDLLSFLDGFNTSDDAIDLRDLQISLRPERMG